MNFASIAQDIMFKTTGHIFWETYPYRSVIGGAGDLHLFEKPGAWKSHDGGIPKNHVKLNIRERLKVIKPDQFPNMDSVGYAVKNILEQCEVKKYISAEDRGWESSDFWATLEAVFISAEDYEKGIVPKIHAYDLLFKGTNGVLWETYPYSSKTEGEEIPRNFVKLNVSSRLKELFPDQSPEPIGNAVKQLLVNCDVRAVEGAVFIPIGNYEKWILPRIYSATASKKRSLTDSSQNL